MESRVNYTLVGLFVVILTAAAIVAGFWLTAGRHTKDYNYYIVYMNEAVSGLSEQAPVKYNGVQVGFVKNIKLDAANPQRVRILLAIVDDTPITTTTSAMLMSQGITGIAYIGLMVKTSDAPPLLATPGEPYPVIPSSPSLFFQLDKTIRDITERIKDVGDGLGGFFTDEAGEDFRSVLQNLRSLTVRLDSTVDKADALITHTAKACEQFPVATKEFRQALRSLQQASQATEKFMHSGKRTVDAINQQAIPPVMDLVNRLDKLTKRVGKLSNELDRNPSMLIRGKAPRHPGPGER